MRCALISRKLNLRDYYGTALARIADRIETIEHPAGPAANDVEMALAWHPHPDAFSHYPNLKAVCTIGAGADNILACPSLPPDVHVVRVVDPAQGELMAGFIIWHVIWYQRRFATFMAQQKAKIWKRLDQRRPADVTVALMGYGQIGQRAAESLRHLGFPVLAWSRTPKQTPAGVRSFHGADGLLAMAAEADVLVNLLPLTPETRGILDRTVFQRLRPGGYLVQVGRGEHLVEADLLAALASSHLSGASLDVFAVEPLPQDHAFWDHPQIVMTPHDACDISAHALMTTMLDTAAAVRSGQRPPHAVDRERGY
jgi:glyoxylate/hydroxypyruvate reductase A